jgi:hypothetical protein
MKYAAEMGTDAMIKTFHKDWFRHSEFNRSGIRRQEIDLISLLLFFSK